MGDAAHGGPRLGRYELLFRLGTGGMAEVYAARIRGEAGFQKLVAIKRILPHLADEPKFVDMFLDEARLAATISSPHVAQTLDLGRDEDRIPFIVLELILGITLEDVMRFQARRKKHIDMAIALELLAQAAQGLDDAHEARTHTGERLELIHRDVSPQNILIGTDGRVRMSDFGIARAARLRRTQTEHGERKGKLAYFSPEQARGDPLDRRTDIYSLGVVAWELLVGRRLFQNTGSEDSSPVHQGPLEPPSALRPELPPETSQLVMRALADAPEERYATAAQMARACRVAAAALGDGPDSRAIGELVEGAGGERLQSTLRTIAQADPPGSVTAQILTPEARESTVRARREAAGRSEQATSDEHPGAAAAEPRPPTAPLEATRTPHPAPAAHTPASPQDAVHSEPTVQLPETQQHEGSEGPAVAPAATAQPQAAPTVITPAPEDRPEAERPAVEGSGRRSARPLVLVLVAVAGSAVLLLGLALRWAWPSDETPSPGESSVEVLSPAEPAQRQSEDSAREPPAPEGERKAHVPVGMEPPDDPSEAAATEAEPAAEPEAAADADQADARRRARLRRRALRRRQQAQRASEEGSGRSGAQAGSGSGREVDSESTGPVPVRPGAAGGSDDDTDVPGLDAFDRAVRGGQRDSAD